MPPTGQQTAPVLSYEELRQVAVKAEMRAIDAGLRADVLRKDYQDKILDLHRSHSAELEKMRRQAEAEVRAAGESADEYCRRERVVTAELQDRVRVLESLLVEQAGRDEVAGVEVGKAKWGDARC